MTVSTSSSQKVSPDLALLAYLIPFLGPLFIFLTRRDDDFARYHAWQGLSLCLATVLAPVIWAVVAWLLTWIPYGALLASFLFAVVIAAWLGAVIAWFVGLRNVLKTKMRPVPMYGGLLGKG